MFAKIKKGRKGLVIDWVRRPPVEKLAVPDRGSRNIIDGHYVLVERQVHDTCPENPHKGVAFFRVRHSEEECLTCQVKILAKKHGVAPCKLDASSVIKKDDRGVVVSHTRSYIEVGGYSIGGDKRTPLKEVNGKTIYLVEEPVYKAPIPGSVGAIVYLERGPGNFEVVEEGKPFEVIIGSDKKEPPKWMEEGSIRRKASNAWPFQVKATVKKVVLNIHPDQWVEKEGEHKVLKWVDAYEGLVFYQVLSWESQETENFNPAALELDGWEKWGSVWM
ncbi:hypothetical protein D6833_04965 [Candidatus Parcubacteria bacterium]|nr:MAG: hypothetical protein D6833_04965 [Candidatus Parcubacteria bacterium]